MRPRDSAETSDEIYAWRASTHPTFQILSLDRLAANAAVESDALAVPEMQFTLPHMQYLDEE
jgi:hypothetical protein